MGVNTAAGQARLKSQRKGLAPITFRKEYTPMSISVFSDKNHPPTQDDVLAELGSQQPLWERLSQFIAKSYQIPGDFTFGGKNYGWNIWYRKGGRTLASLYPQHESFVIQIVLGKAEVEKALGLSLGDHVGKMLRETPQLHDGCWLFIPIQSEKDVEDVEGLLQVKRRPVKS